MFKINVLSILSSAYDVPAITQHLHFIHIMAYDYHGSWDFRNIIFLASSKTSSIFILLWGGAIYFLFRRNWTQCPAQVASQQ
jgi:hypothetical protein